MARVKHRFTRMAVAWNRDAKMELIGPLSPGRAARRRELAEEAIFWVLTAGLAWAPFWYGGNDRTAWGINAVLFPGLAALYELSLLVHRQPDLGDDGRRAGTSAPRQHQRQSRSDKYSADAIAHRRKYFLVSRAALPK